MPEDNKQEKSSRDNLALIVGVIFIMGLVFAAYTYFNQDSVQDKIKRNADKVEDIISSNTDRDDEEEEEAPSEETEDRDEIISNGSLGTGGPSAVWEANDYQQGDITGNSYTVVSGDTLWEIAEAVYGNGADWVKILQANSDDIGFLPNGSQALIIPGQVLNLP